MIRRPTLIHSVEALILSGVSKMLSSSRRRESGAQKFSWSTEAIRRERSGEGERSSVRDEQVLPRTSKRYRTGARMYHFPNSNRAAFFSCKKLPSLGNFTTVEMLPDLNQEIDTFHPWTSTLARDNTGATPCRTTPRAQWKGSVVYTTRMVLRIPERCELVKDFKQTKISEKYF